MVAPATPVAVAVVVVLAAPLAVLVGAKSVARRLTLDLLDLAP